MYAALILVGICVASFVLQLAVQGALCEPDINESSGVTNARRIEKLPWSEEAMKSRNKKRLSQPDATWPVPAAWGFIALENSSRGTGIFCDGDWVESKDQDPSGGIRLTQLADVGDGFYRDRSKRFMNHETAERLRCTFLLLGDVLIARMPNPLGRACIFPGDAKPCVTAVDVCILRPNIDFFAPKFLVFCINSTSFRSRVYSKATGTTRQRISRGNLGKLPIPVPPLPEQRRIVAKVDGLLALCDELEARQQKKRQVRVAAGQAAVDRLVSAP